MKIRLHLPEQTVTINTPDDIQNQRIQTAQDAQEAAGADEPENWLGSTSVMDELIEERLRTFDAGRQS